MATGPDHGNSTDPTDVGQAVWIVLQGETTAPAAPRAPSATAPASGELDWSWNCPLDGGAIIDDFRFQWRVSGTQSWSGSIIVTTPRHALTGLTNGTAIEARVRAVTTFATGPWSLVGSATPAGTIPGGGATLALRAEAADAEVDLDWLEPDDGGLSISSYRVQWRTAGQGYSTARQDTSNNEMHTVSSLTNGTEYFFRVRAVNSQGNGNWSNEASATPAADVVPPPPDADEVPSAPQNLAGTPRRPLMVDFVWELPDDNGGAQITSFDSQWRFQGSGWSGNLTNQESTHRRITVSNANTAVQARVRARNSVGASSWSSTVTVSAGDLTGGMCRFGSG